MRARGYTLVEVMVALAIVAITLPALLMALYQQVDDAEQAGGNASGGRLDAQCPGGERQR